MLMLLLAIALQESDGSRSAALEKYAELLKSAEQRYFDDSIKEARKNRQPAEVKSLEEKRDLWKGGLYRPEGIAIGPLQAEKLAVWQVGDRLDFAIVSVVDETTFIVRLSRQDRKRNDNLSMIVNARIAPASADVEGRVRGVFWVSGKRKVGERELLIIEPLFEPNSRFGISNF